MPPITSHVASGVTQRLPLPVAAARLDGSRPHDRGVCLINMQEGSVPVRLPPPSRMPSQGE